MFVENIIDTLILKRSNYDKYKTLFFIFSLKILMEN